MNPERTRLSRRSLLTGSLSGIGALAVDRAFAGPVPAALATPATTPPGGVLKLYHIHTGESLEVEYRRGHAVVSSALGDIDHLLRDFRADEEKPIDIDALDTLSLLYDQFGRRGRFEVICGYRSPTTNAALRRVTSGVAKHSLHMSGRAIDVRLVGTRTNRLRDAALALKRGGVGYYASSNFVHVDTGAVRSW
jgi:uncharacterized protein YcbK (DUF882 family)